MRWQERSQASLIITSHSLLMSLVAAAVAASVGYRSQFLYEDCDQNCSYIAVYVTGIKVS